MVGMFILLHKRLKQAVDWQQTDKQTDRQTDYRNTRAHVPSVNNYCINCTGKSPYPSFCKGADVHVARDIGHLSYGHTPTKPRL